MSNVSERKRTEEELTGGGGRRWVGGWESCFRFVCVVCVFSFCLCRLVLAVEPFLSPLPTVPVADRYSFSMTTSLTFSFFYLIALI